MKKMMRYFVRMVVPVMVLACFAINAHALEKSYYAESSKLVSGKWVKIAVKESGIYQITADDIRDWGLGSDLSQIHVFGYGGAPLSETMLGDNYVDDLPQVPVVRAEGSILFYAQGPTTWRRYGSYISHLQIQHPYANSGSYFVTNDSRFSDVEIAKADNSPAGSTVTTYLERLFHEQDIINPGETGRVYLGESFVSDKNQTFKFKLDGLVDGSLVRVYTGFGAQTVGAKSTVAFSYNGTPIPVTDNDLMNANTSLQHDHYSGLHNGLKTFTLEGTEDLDYTLSYSCNGTVNLARLDYITVNYERPLALRNGSLAFGYQEASSSKSYRLTNCGSSTRVWDVTKPFALVQLNTTSNEGGITFSPATSGRREFVAFDESGTYSHPEFLGEIDNQNIHGEPVPDMIILAPSAYLSEAKRVATLHEKYDHFRVLVLDHEKVFNEFSSGTQDAMAYRRLCKMFYDRGASEDGHKLGYLLLLGGGSYDNRLVGVNANVLNFPHLLTWQTTESQLESTSITSDDFFGVLSDESGVDASEKMDIAVGRMIVRSTSEARTAVNKLVNYVSKPSYGAWKNQALMVADDENNGVHMQQDSLMVEVARQNGGNDIVFNRVYIDAFTAVSNGGSRSYPDARTKLFTTLNEGALWWSYIGHASTQNWTGEGLLMRSDVETQLFYKHLPVLYAATCEYCRFDNSITSSGELMYLNANGGVIALLCPPRLAYVSNNGALSAKLGLFIFSPDVEGKPRRVGDILRLAKNSINTSSDNNRRFFVFGDPAMRLAYAPYHIEVETINGQPVDTVNMPVFKAREQVEFGGKILNLSGELATNFNGSVVSTLFDAEQSITTHGYGEEGKEFTYQDRLNRLAINVDTVVGGRFTVRVIIPSEVNNEYDNYSPALINLYAYDSRDTLEAKGCNSNFYIYGYEDELVGDTIGPNIIVMNLNDDKFVDGAEVNESPLLLATVSDESGVNFSSAGIGHNMTLTLDGTISFNDLVSYYTPQFAQTGTLGNITYQLNDLSPGPHTLRLRVWDVYNNVGEKTINFNVVNGLAPEIADVYCAANPASVETSFYVKHNRPDAVVTVTIEVYDLMGRRVWSATQSGRSDMYTSTPVTWDLTDVSGRRVPRGIYVYRATITTDGIKEATKAKKLAVTGE
ncbi:MAG: type IX secretion system sortase PorU [Muribaculaceae bacterium]|nr:type IX secretion system sortase PorU [Muribaculaceae bacterium]